MADTVIPTSVGEVEDLEEFEEVSEVEEHGTASSGDDGPGDVDGASPAGQPDERLSFRGPIQRLLTRPEIGALIGAFAVWALFWLVGGNFGTAGATANFLDVASTLGIMSVAVGLLMIGGEFDLSSGSMTGATAIFVLLATNQVGELGGAGLNFHIAVPMSLLFALGVGWFNGTVVEKTSLPSFIVTLGTFFVLIGGKLGFAKRFTDKVIVGRDDAADPEGWEFWRGIFAGQWIAQENVWAQRDMAWAILLIVGAALLTLGTIYMSYRRTNKMSMGGLLLFAVGTAASIAGLLVLLNTDGVSNNVIGGVLVGAGALLAAVGFGLTFFHRAAPVSEEMPSSAPRLFIAGGGFLAAGIIAGLVIMSDNEDSIGIITGDIARAIFFIGLALVGLLALAVAAGKAPVSAPLIGVAIAAVPSIAFLVTIQGARAILFAGLVIVGTLLMMAAAAQVRKSSSALAFVLGIANAGALVIVAFFVRAEGTGRQIRVELFTSILIASFFIALGTVMRHLFSPRVGPDLKADRIGKIVNVVGAIAVFVAILVRLLFIIPEEEGTNIGGIPLRISVLWFGVVIVIATFVLEKTKFGSWVYAVGGNKEAARSIGVPAARTKTSLFMIVSAAAWLVGMLTAFRFESIQADVGDGLEFRFIIAAVVGGCLLNGGYGSTLGAAIGAIIFAMIRSGIGFAGWDTNWQFLILGVLLLGAVIVNNSIRQRALKS